MTVLEKKYDETRYRLGRGTLLSLLDGWRLGPHRKAWRNYTASSRASGRVRSGGGSGPWRAGSPSDMSGRSCWVWLERDPCRIGWILCWKGPCRTGSCRKSPCRTGCSWGSPCRTGCRWICPCWSPGLSSWRTGWSGDHLQVVSCLADAGDQAQSWSMQFCPHARDHCSKTHGGRPSGPRLRQSGRQWEDPQWTNFIKALLYMPYL